MTLCFEINEFKKFLACQQGIFYYKGEAVGVEHDEFWRKINGCQPGFGILFLYAIYKKSILGCNNTLQVVSRSTGSRFFHFSKTSTGEIELNETLF